MNSKRMKAVVFQKTEGLVVEDVPVPQVNSGEVLVKIANTGFCGSDHSMIQGKSIPDGYILGHEVSGIIAEKGAHVDSYPTGTRVIIRPTFCGQCHDCLSGRPHFCPVNRRLIGVRDLPGGFAEYVKVFAQMLIPIPENVDSHNAALAETAASSFHALKYSGKQGGSVLVIGGGPIGLVLVQLLKLHGFGPIVLSEPVTTKRKIGEKFGADVTIDPFNQNLGYLVFECTNDLGFDVIFECSGVPENFQKALEFVANRGMVCVVSVIYRALTIPPRLLNQREVIITGSYSNTHAENKQCLKWMAEGKLDTRPMITDLISLEQLPETYNDRVISGKATKVLLKIGEEF